MQITAQSEWMEDQKQAVVMAPGKSFQVLQTRSGRSLFFSIGTDGILYATQEVQASATGWKRINLSAKLSSLQDAKINAKSFSLAQNPKTLSFDLAVVVTAGTSDHLYLSLGNDNTDESWERIASSGTLVWAAAPFNAPSSSYQTLQITAVHLMSLPSENVTSGSQQCFVDVLQGTPETNRHQLIDRYYVNPTERMQWRSSNLAIDLAASSIQNALGHRSEDAEAGGLYAFGNIENTMQLLYTPAYNIFDPNVAPNPSRLSLPSRATAIASAFDSSGFSSLFVAAEKGIYVYPPDKQDDGSTPIPIMFSPIVFRASQLQAITMGSTTAIYGISTRGELFYSTCAAGSETSPAAWCVPVPLATSVDKYAFFINPKANNNTVFAHVADRDIAQLTQDPITKDWVSRAILLPSTDVDDVITLDSFSTRIIVQQDKNATGANIPVHLTSTSPVGVYVNNVYRVLNPVTPVIAMTTTDGAITIVQPTQDSVAVCYKAALGTDTTSSISIDPALKVKDRFSTLKSRKDLDNAMVKQADGSSRPLVPAGVSDTDREAAVSAIQAMMGVASKLPKDGSPATSSTAKSSSTKPNTQEMLCINTSSQGSMSLSLGKAIALNAQDLFVKAGDLFRSILHATWNSIQKFVLRIVDDIHEVLVQIGDVLYRTVLDCVASVSHAVEWVFSKIKVGIEDIKKWAGFLFNWGDIVRTHKVVKNIITRYAYHGLSDLQNVQAFIENSFDSLDDKLKAWADLPPSNNRMGQISTSTQTKHTSYNDPQTHYIHDKASEHLGEAESSVKASKAASSGGWSGVLSQLKELATAEGKALNDTITALQTQIIEPFDDLTLVEIIKRLSAIIGSFVLQTAKNVLSKTVGIVEDLSTAILESLNSPIKIPVLSKLYKTIADEELSIMDLVCLVAAAPATLIYKAMTGSTPFPDSASTTALIQAKDFLAIQNTIFDSPDLYKTITIAAEFLAMAGLLFDVLLNTIKLPLIEKGEPHKVPAKIRQVSLAVKLLILMPDYLRPRRSSDPWFLKMDAMITDFAFYKTCIDATEIGEKDIYGTVGPYLDYAISAAWMVPAIAKVVDNSDASYSKSSNMTTLATNLAYDVAVMTAPVVWNPLVDPETKTIIFVGANAVVVIASVIRVATGGLIHDGD